MSYPGGPLSRKVFRLSSGEKGGARSSREWSEVMAYSCISSVSVRKACGEGGRRPKRGGGQRLAACQGSIFIGMLVKPAGKISV